MMENQISQVSIAYNGDLVISGYFKGHHKVRTLTQEQAIWLLESV